jgi:penicillin-binding protein 1A
MFFSRTPLVTDTGIRGFLKRVAVFLVAVVALAGGGLAAHIAMLSSELPDLSSLERYDPPTTSKVFDRHGHVVARFYEERRTVVPITKIPAHVRHAFISAEDAAFYSHKGVDYPSIVRAVLYQVRHALIGGPQSGGSTITQQTAKTFLLSPERTMSRKVKEMMLAKRIEERFSKDEILSLYLNQIYFGNGAYGIEEAAQTYYGRSVDKLTLGQAAVLASIPKSPNRINPWADPRRVRARRAYVLEQMKKNGHITAAEEEKANAEPVRLDVTPPEFLDVAPYYAEHIRRLLKGQLPEEDLARGGLSVYAAVDGALQKAANDAVDHGLRELDKRQGYRGPLVRLDPDEARAMLALLDEERRRRFPAEETPELDDPLAEGRPLWDLTAVTARDLRTILQSARNDDEDEPSDEERRLEALITDKAKLSTSPPLRSVRGARLQIGARLAGVVVAADNAARQAQIDLGTTTASLPMSSLGWARAFNPEKSTERPRAVGDVFKVGDIVLVRIERIVPATPEKPATKKGGKTVKATLAKPAFVEVSLEQEPKAQAGFVALDPRDHRVLALVGGSHFATSSFNRATQAVRQAGSSLKPFIYGTGIELGAVSSVGFVDKEPAGVRHRLITDAPKVFLDPWTGKKWAPQNSSGRFLGDITTRTCLTHSVNTCSISILEKVGVDRVIETATKLGLETKEKLPRNLTLALGTGGVHLLDLVNAYAVFPDGGRHLPPVLIEKVKRKDGTTAWEAPRPAPVQVFSPSTAFIMTDLMKSVVENGTATRARSLGRPVAGKTGTTDGARSVWFVGFTPDVVAGVYVGFDDNAPLGVAESGGRAAVPMWLRFMETATRETPVRDFAVPEGVERRSVDVRTGLLVQTDAALMPGQLPEPTFDDPDGDPIPATLPEGVIAEVFAAGTSPVQTAEDAPPPPLELRETGGLAP